MDTIEVSNLNRQFLFRQSHVGQSKAKVARDAVLKFRPQINITSYHANIKNPDFNVDFFRQFSVVLNGLDNLDARRHVNRLCLAASVPLIESVTTGFLGQVTVHVNGRTECYECQAKPAPKTYPVCTITSTPSKNWSGIDRERLRRILRVVRCGHLDFKRPCLKLDPRSFGGWWPRVYSITSTTRSCDGASVCASRMLFPCNFSQESSLIHSNANLGVHGQGLLNFSGSGDCIVAQHQC